MQDIVAAHQMRLLVFEPTRFDERNDHDVLLDVGWDRTGRMHAVVLPVRLRDNQVWGERDGTEAGVAQELLEAGAPKADVVLGFSRPERRALTAFAVI